MAIKAGLAEADAMEKHINQVIEAGKEAAFEIKQILSDLENETDTKE
jgi:hypothetical protein